MPEANRVSSNLTFDSVHFLMIVNIIKIPLVLESGVDGLVSFKHSIVWVSLFSGVFYFSWSLDFGLRHSALIILS
jgi:hypothetical protein